MIFNATQHNSTPEQISAGVVDPPPDVKADLMKLLTFETIPDYAECARRARLIVNMVVASGCRSAMIGGAPYLMPQLQSELFYSNLRPLYSFSQRVSEESIIDGVVKKTSTFKHAGFVGMETPELNENGSRVE